MLNFSQAQKIARAKHAEAAEAAKAAAEPSPEKPYTVRDAIADYVKFLEAKRETGKDARYRAARYGALAALKVGDFSVNMVRRPDGSEVEHGTVHIVTKKGRGGKVKHVHVVLTEEGIEFFRMLTAGRDRSALMLPRADGGRWLKSQQDRPMEAASRDARIEPPVNFHVMRHTYASLAIMGSAPLFVVAKNLGHSDTRMVERHYGHLAASYVGDVIRDRAMRLKPYWQCLSRSTASAVRR